MDVFATPLEKAQKLFAEAKTGNFRGRESFCKILEAKSNLSLAGFNLQSQGAYSAINSSKQEVDDLLRAKYRRAALENYQDSTDARFTGSGRTILEALSDLHLVPVYMEFGGLNPEKKESWEECGIDHDDYLAVYSARRIDEAARILSLVKNPERQPASNCIALESALDLLREAGLDITKEETYRRLQTTKQDFDSYFTQQKQRALNPYSTFSHS